VLAGLVVGCAPETNLKAEAKMQRDGRRIFTYSNVVATLALFFALTGAAVAGTHYLISSTRQIKPSVLKSIEGQPGPATTKLAKGQTLRGTFIVLDSTANGLGEASISFGEQLASAPKVVVVTHGATSPASCAGGTVEHPEAKPGYLCIYEQETLGSTTLGVFPANGAATEVGKASPFGVLLQINGGPAGGLIFGSWAVTG
jgi:hypothetical protein